MTQDEIIEMANQAELCQCIWIDDEGPEIASLVAFAKLVAAHAVAKDREEFDIDELCARQNKIGYKQGYNAGVLAEREECAKVCDDVAEDYNPYRGFSALGATECATAIRARGEA